MCMGVEHGEILAMGEDLFGWAWDVAYQLGEELADGKTHEILMGPKIFELAETKWKAPDGVKFEAKELDVNGTKITGHRMYTESDKEDKAAEEEKKKAEEAAAEAT